ncbi:MAG: hypothetical protein ABIQ81_05255 [Novosphingobium sp.]
MYRLLPALIATLTFGAPAAGQAYEQLPRQLASLTPADFARSARISDDPLKAAVVLSTEKGYTRTRLIQGARADDVHLRAVVDRSTGRVTWQVWHQLIDVSAHLDVVAVTYVDGGALRQVRPIAQEHALALCPPTDGPGMCSKVTRVGFELPDGAVREIAAGYRPNSRTPWRLRFKGASGRDVTGGLAPAEAAGLINAVEAWRGHAAQPRRID